MSKSEPLVLSFAADPLEKRWLETEDLRAILSEVARKPNVGTLVLQGNLLSVGCVNLLCQYLKNSARIHGIDVSMCGLGDKGAIDLVRAICSTQSRGRAATYIKKLDLSWNYISPDGAAKIGIAMSQASHCTLRDLTVKFNAIGCAGLLGLMRQRVPLTTLDCRYCSLDVENSFSKMLQGVKETRNLKQVFLDGNKLTEDHTNQLLEALATNPKSALKEEEVLIGPGAGELVEMAAHLANQDKTEEMYPAGVLADFVKLEGELAVVRGNVRGCAAETKPEAGSKSRGTSCRSHSRQRVAPVQIVRKGGEGGLTSRSASVANRSVSRHSAASRTCHQDPYVLPNEAAPQLRKKIEEKKNKDTEEESPANNENEEEKKTTPSKENELDIPPPQEDQTPYVAPSKPTMVLSSIDRASLAKSRSCYQKSKNESMPPEGDHCGLQLDKGKQARMLLDRCVASDQQCATILNLDDLALLGKGHGGEINVPAALVGYNAVPSHLDSLDLHSGARIGGIAKLLYCILHAPGKRCHMDKLREMTDIPSSIKNCGSKTTQAKYRSARNVENRDARNMLTTLQQQQNKSAAATPRNSSTSYRRSQSSSRYLDFYRSASKSSAVSASASRK